MAEEKTGWEKEELSKGSFAFEVLRAIAITLGLSLLWAMEAARDRFFRLLDQWHIPSFRWRKASAFPPGPSQR
ncbi:MAG TPA: hypothetical protein VMB26_04000 [Candidatus Binataceae bacterium]|nr:hypothetical protein [Candidatus Binataceae bacterium]